MAIDAKLRSPLKEPPLRQAGQSLDESFRDVLDDKVWPWLLIPAVLVVLAALEWLRYFRRLEPYPWTLSFIALAALAAGTFMLRRAVIEARHLKLGRDGERSVADTLQPLVAAGWQIFHDIPGNGFNIDHVAIGPGGIFTIETKTRSKPEGKRAKIVVDRSGISVAGSPSSRDAMEQAVAQSAWLADMLKRSTSKTFRVRPVVLFPGWYVVRKTPRRTEDPWVLEPKAFVKWLNRERVMLTEEQIAMASLHLSRLVNPPR